MGSYTTRLTWEVRRTIDSADFTGDYQPLGTPLTNPSYILKLINLSGVVVDVSIDGENDYDVAPSMSGFILDESKGVNGIGPLIAVPAGTQIYVKGAASTGLVYLVSQYLIQQP